MATPRENFLRLMKNDSPKWLGDPWSCFNQTPGFRPVTMDCVAMSLGSAQPGQVGVKNAWGVTMDFPEGQPGGIPHVTDENKVIKDITHWQDYVVFPDIDNVDWSFFPKMYPNLEETRKTHLIMAGSFTGMFEFSHYMMGFSDALENYLMEPESMYELLSAYTDWKIKAAAQVIDHIKPDILHSHDDWGNKLNLFLPPKTFREILKPLYERFYGYVQSRGVLVQHHNDSVSDIIAEDMVDMHIDMWQGPIPGNKFDEIVEKVGSKLCLMGGFDMGQIDKPNATEAEVKAHCRQVIDTYMPLNKKGGAFIPCITSIFAIHPQVDQWIAEELDRYGAEYAAKNF
ncbi:MAG: uroporphyrinogen decarboxylase (URO-D) [Oscillospiraceae bacterium]|jgi:uroporphyrinogen-III decarboxylase|nr:uroporphyrinogen decarboxylase (URO-D) [Oscillospiraceae bacterium]